MDLLMIGIAVAAAAACTAGTFAAYRRRHRAGEASVRHMACLAMEILSVAATIDAAAAERPGLDLTDLCAECLKYRACAERTLREVGEVQLLGAGAIKAVLLALHEDHRKILELRSEADRALAVLKAYEEDRCRIVSMRPSRASTWSASLFTRPSTLS